MIKFLSLTILFVVAILAVLLYTSQSKPEWYSADNKKSDQLTQQLSEDIQKRGASKFLGQKFAQVMSGQLTLSETEFNALVLASLKSSKDGRRLLSFSDGVHASLRKDVIEFGAVIDLEKAVRVDAKAKAAIRELKEKLPFIGESKIYLAIQGTPLAKNGDIGFNEDVSVRIGSIPLSSSLLRQLGVPVHKVSSETLPIKLMKIQKIETKQGEIVLDVLPRF